LRLFNTILGNTRKNKWNLKNKLLRISDKIMDLKIRLVLLCGTELWILTENNGTRTDIK
jgi:hypothetical protein